MIGHRYACIPPPTQLFQPALLRMPLHTVFRFVMCLAAAMSITLFATTERCLTQEIGDSEKAGAEAYELTFPAMGTMLAFQAFSHDEKQVERVFSEARNEVDRLVEILSDYSTESETVRLSEGEKIGQWQTPSPELWEVLEVCDRWHHLSGGAFDASVGRLSLLWRKARKAKTVPTQKEIHDAMQLCGWQHVHFDRTGHRIKLSLPGIKLDFGAMGKGYIIDKAYERLAKGGLPCALVRAGGDLRCGDAPPNRQGWPIEIAQLSDKETPQQLYLANAAVSSSGDLYQYFEIDGVRRSHVLDPRTGLGVPGPRLVTVVAATATEADAADTALCVMSDDAALKVARQLGDIDIRLATLMKDADQEKLIVHATPGFGRAFIKPR